ALAVAAFGLVPAAALERVTHGGFSYCVFGMNLLPYSVGQIVPVLIHQAGIAFGLIALAAVRVHDRWRSGTLEPIDYYFAGVVLATVPSLGRAGAHGQYVLEMLVVTVLLLLGTGGL